MKLADLITKIHSHWQQKLPFVLYALPDENSMHVLLQHDDVLHTSKEFNAPAFLFAPFKYNDESLCIPEAVSERIEIKGTFPTKTNISTPLCSDSVGEKEKHEAYVSQILAKIQTRVVTKVVATRKKEVALENFNFSTLVSRIIALDVSAFRYIWYHPKTGIWCGATPEVLFLSDGASFSTMALAGTQKANGDAPPIWGAKEYFEQQLVTEAITNNLQRITTVIKASKPKTHRAGSLYHIKTHIQGVLKNGRTTLPKIASVLHPTPAVCGAPRKEAFKIIQESEGYDREFYTGFLGPIHQQKDTAQLFVNLRCMKITPNKATIYVGGGITLDSVPEEEWLETQHKTAIMLRVLAPMLS